MNKKTKELLKVFTDLLKDGDITNKPVKQPKKDPLTGKTTMVLVNYYKPLVDKFLKSTEHEQKTLILSLQEIKEDLLKQQAEKLKENIQRNKVQNELEIKGE